MAATNILYKFLKMDLAQFATFEESLYPEKTDIDINNSFRISYNFDLTSVLVNIAIEYKKNENYLLKAELNSYFKIAPESAKKLEKGNDTVLPASLLVQFASLAMGAMRGIIFAKTIGTPLSSIILPPVNPGEVIKKDMIFRKEGVNEE